MNRSDKTTAGLLALLVGGLGVHKFYLGKSGQGILYFVFCWTWIPAVLGVIEGILYLTMSQQEFDYKYNAGAMMLGYEPEYQAPRQPQQIAQSVTINLPEGYGPQGVAQGVSQSPAPRQLPQGDDMVARLTKLNELRVAGLLSDQEFQQQKQRILNQC